MKRKILFIIMAVMITLGLSSCKKDFMERLLDDGTFVECNVNGVFAKEKGQRNSILEDPELYMSYFYNNRDTFTFRVSRRVLGENNQAYDIALAVAKTFLPVVGKQYDLQGIVDNERLPHVFHDSGYQDGFSFASVGIEPYIYEYADTALLPVDVRKRRIMLRTNVVLKGSITFTKLDIENGDINGVFEYEAQGTSTRVPAISYEMSITNGQFECHGMTRSKYPAYYSFGLCDIIY